MRPTRHAYTVSALVFVAAAFACGAQHLDVTAPLAASGSAAPPAKAPEASPAELARRASEAMNAGLDARLDGEHARAKKLFLVAHDAAPPDGDALFEAALEARALGDAAGAGALLTRARAELEQEDPDASWEIAPTSAAFAVDTLYGPAQIDDHTWALLGQIPEAVLVDPRTPRAIDVDLSRGTSVKLGPFDGVLGAIVVPAVVESVDGRFVAVENKAAGEDDESWVSVLDRRSGARVAFVPGGVAGGNQITDGGFRFLRQRPLFASIGATDEDHPDAPFLVHLLDVGTWSRRVLVAPAPPKKLSFAWPESDFTTSDDGRVLMAFHVGQVVVWDIDSGQMLATALGSSSGAAWMTRAGTAVAFKTEDAGHIAVSVLDVATGKVFGPLVDPGCDDEVGMFDRRGELLVVGNISAWQPCATVWSLAERRALATVVGETYGTFRGLADDGSVEFVHMRQDVDGLAVDRIDSYDWHTRKKVGSRPPPRAPGPAPGATVVVDGFVLRDARDKRVLCTLATESRATPRLAERERLVVLAETGGGGRGTLEAYDTKTCAPRWLAGKTRCRFGARSFPVEMCEAR